MRFVALILVKALLGPRALNFQNLVRARLRSYTNFMGVNTTLAAVMVSPRQTELRELPLPDIPSDGGLLRVVATGICGSDWPKYLSEKFAPSILGHEIVGYVEKLGDAARYRWGVKEGDYVALEEYLPCGHCDFCRSGEYRSCLETDFHVEGSIRYGSTRLTVAPALYGGYSQFLYLHPRTILHRVPDGIAPHIAAMALPLGNGFQWTTLDGEAGPGKTVVIIGPGQQGFGCVVAAAASGATNVVVVGLARDKARFPTAMKLGATHTIMVDEEDVRARVKDITGGAMADVVIDTSSAGPEIVNGGLSLLKKRGKLLCTALKKSAVPFDLDRFIKYQVRMMGTRGHSFEAVEMALGLMKSRKYPLELISTHVVGLRDVDRALKIVGGESAEKAIHITVEPWK
jgi:threonine dehydrogenase-like Zn-dependent dehydrogenase